MLKDLVKEMPNKRYRKGYRKENNLMNAFKEGGCIAARSAGSHSPVDVWAINPETKRVYLIQCKPDSMSEKNKNRLREEMKKCNGLFDVSFDVL